MVNNDGSRRVKMGAAMKATQSMDSLTEQQRAIVERIRTTEEALSNQRVEAMPQWWLMMAHFVHLNEMRRKPNPYHSISTSNSPSDRASR